VTCKKCGGNSFSIFNRVYKCTCCGHKTILVSIEFYNKAIQLLNEEELKNRGNMTRIENIGEVL